MNPRKKSTEREMGLLSQLALQQESYRGLLRDLQEATPDKTYLEAARERAVTDVDEDKVIALASIRFEMKGFAEPEMEDLIWASELLDHLDTLGWKLERK